MNAGTMAAGLGVLAVVFYIVIRRIGDVTWKHHGWYGLALMAVNWVVLVALGPSRINVGFFFAGALLYFEDLVTHVIQINNPKFVGPVHRIYEKTLYRWFPRLG